MNEPLDLTCRVEGIEITADNVKWYKYNPGEDNVGLLRKHYSLSSDGLTLTIKKMSDTKVGSYKCVVEKDGKSSEAEFEVSLPIRHEDLIEPKAESVAFFEGRTLTLEVVKLGGTITEIYWECNGVRVVKGEGRAKIINNGKGSKLILKPAKLEDVGSCICIANGVGTQDSAEITVGGDENTVVITPVKTEVSCTEKKKGCKVEFTVTRAEGAVKAADVKICKLVDGVLKSCSKSKLKKDKYWSAMGNKTPISASGEYMAVYTKDGVETQGGPVTVTVKAKKAKKEKKVREPKEEKEPKEKKVKKNKKNKDQ